VSIFLFTSPAFFIIYVCDEMTFTFADAAAPAGGAVCRKSSIKRNSALNPICPIPKPNNYFARISNQMF